MKIIITSCIVIAILLYISGINISFKPFSIHFDRPYLGLSILFLAISLSFYGTDAKMEGYRKGYKEWTDAVIALLKNKTK